MKKPETLAERTARLKALRLAHEAEMPPPINRNPTLYRLDTVINRGKHAGMTVEDLLHEDPSYVRYMIEEWQDVEFALEVEDCLASATDPRRGPRAWE